MATLKKACLFYWYINDKLEKGEIFESGKESALKDQTSKGLS